MHHGYHYQPPRKPMPFGKQLAIVLGCGAFFFGFLFLRMVAHGGHGVISHISGW